MFEKISKGEVSANIIETIDFGVAAVSNESKVIAQCNFIHPLSEENKANAEFIAYCFNLQQRLDIVCYEGAIKALEECVSLLSHEGYDMRARGIEQILNKAKKI